MSKIELYIDGNLVFSNQQNDEQKETKTITVLTTLRYRDKPSTAGSIIGTFPKGTQIEVYDAVISSSGYQWVKISDDFNNGIYRNYYIAINGDDKGSPDDPFLTDFNLSGSVDVELDRRFVVEQKNNKYVFKFNDEDRAKSKVGFNIREAIHLSEISQHVDWDSVTRNIAKMAYHVEDDIPDSFISGLSNHAMDGINQVGIGAGILRVYVPHTLYGNNYEAMLNNIRELMDRVVAVCSPNGQSSLKVLFVLNDSLGASGYTLASEKKYHTMVYGHLNINYWNDEAYKKDMADMIRYILPTLIEEYPNHIFGFELFNEPTLFPVDRNHTNHLKIRYAFDWLSELVHKQTKGAYPIFTGTMNFWQIAPYHDMSDVTETEIHQFYSNLPYINGVSVAMYQERNNFGEPSAEFYELWAEEEICLIEYKASLKTEKPFIIKEFAPFYYQMQTKTHMPGDATPTNAMEELFQRWKDKASAFIGWAFQWEPYDKGFGDKQHGFDITAAPNIVPDMYKKMQNMNEALYNE